MLDYDEIIEMLDWNNPPEVQEKGIELARQVKCLNVFLQPFLPNASKSLWENCAIVLCEKTDIELRPYLYDLLWWISDLNVPGAELIFERLKKFEFSIVFQKKIEKSKLVAIALNDRFLLSLIKEIEESVNKTIEE